MLLPLNPEKIVVADCETDGLIPEMTRVHLITCGFLRSDDVLVYRRNEEMDTIEVGLEFLMQKAQEGYTIAFHNGIGFDYEALRKVYPWFDVPKSQWLDTLVFARLKYPDLNLIDAKLIRKGTLPKNLRGRQSLEAWGHRCGVQKGEYEGDTRLIQNQLKWLREAEASGEEAQIVAMKSQLAQATKEIRASKWERWNPDMETYAIQDIVSTRALIEKTKPWDYSHQAVEIEHDVAWIIRRQEKRGFGFDEDAAAELYGTLSKKQGDLRRTLEASVEPMIFADGKPFTPKRDNTKRGYTGGVPFTKIKYVPFNPTSRQHVAKLLKLKYQWVPEKFTDGGDPAIDEAVLGKLEYPEAKQLSQLFTLAKRVGQIAEGDKAWLKLVRDGRIFGRVNTNGAVTGRMTHLDPNLAQVPKVGSFYGAECRALFIAGVGYVLVGGDASGLELRMLGHYMAKWDGGAYARAVVEGKQEDGSDVHSLNCKALGMDPKKVYVIGGKQAKGRDIAKTFIYAFLYGAGDEKIGKILGCSAHKARQIKLKFLRNLPALDKLIKAVKRRAKENGYLIGLDGRRIPVRSQHAALNTLLQGAGACVMKKALVLTDESLLAQYTPGDDYEFVANVHDEFQMESKQEYADGIGSTVVASIRRAGEHFALRCPLDGEYKAGRNWAETH